MDQKVIFEGAYDTYEVVNGRKKIQHHPIITNESGELVFGTSYWGYHKESYDEAMERKASEKKNEN